MQNIISLDTEKLARRGFQHEGPPHTHTGETRGELGPLPPPPPRVPTPMNFSKHLTDCMVRSQYCGFVWVKEEGSWRDLEICASPKVGGGRKPPSAPPFLESGGERVSPFPPLFLRLWGRPITIWICWRQLRANGTFHYMIRDIRQVPEKFWLCCHKKPNTVLPAVNGWQV